MLFEMNDSINRLSMINVDAKWAEFRDALKKLHHERIVLLHEMNQMSKTLLAGAEPDVNYGKLTAPAPKIPGSSGTDRQDHLHYSESHVLCTCR